MHSEDQNNKHQDEEIIEDEVDQIVQVRLPEFESDDPPPTQELNLEEIPVLPLRGLVVFPQTAVPLTVGQPRSIRLVDDVVATENRVIGLFAAHNPENESPNPDEIYKIGTLAQIHRLFRAPDGTIRLLVQGVRRIEVEEFTATEPYLKARIQDSPENLAESLEIEALSRMVVDLFSRLADLVPGIPGELISSALNMDDPLQLIYTVATYVRIDLKDQYHLLEIDSLEDKLRELMRILQKELEVLELGHQIQTEAQSEMEKVQREYYLREQLKAIQRELGEGDEQIMEIEEFRQKIDASHMPEEAEKEARRELDRLARLPTAAAEYGVIRTYLDWLVSMPWDVRTDDKLNIANARKILNEDHYDLEDIKERILEFLAVRKLLKERQAELPVRENEIRRKREGAILCFIGPPGVGKTSLGASIARAMGRKFIRMSLGGIRDEAEIRGFRRTYIGAMPGRIVQTIRRAETRNPVIMLDEIDKLGRDFRGDPASALLEVLDPEQNFEFRDHYLDVPFDLSEAMFITTANELDPIPRPLLDRMEIIRLSGYTEQEKIQIAKNYLVPRQVNENGLFNKEITFREDALISLIRDYTREAGVRNLEREIGKVARKVVTKIAEGEAKRHIITAKRVREMLGHPPFGYRTEIEERVLRPGVATGLAWTPVGGDVLFVEANDMLGKGNFKLTGQLGSVMQESAQTAYSYVRTRHVELEVADDYFEKYDIHLHVPAGAIPKDGPSAGVTIATAIASLVTKRLIRDNVAMTGEITLHGQVLPVGGVKEKVLAAHRLGLDTVILPERNLPDLEDLPREVRETMHFVPARNIDAVWNAALEPRST